MFINKLKWKRFKKIFVENKFKLLFGFIVFCSMFLSVGYSLLNVKIEIDGTVKIVDNESTCNSDIDIQFVVLNYWKNTYNANFIITNNSDEDLDTHYIKIKGPSDLRVQGFYENAQSDGLVYSDDTGLATLISNKDGYYYWHNLVKPGETREIWFAIHTIESTEESPALPEYITYNGCKIYGNGSSNNNQETDVLKEIVLTPIEETIIVGDSINMLATKVPLTASGDIIWTSSDQNVATVSNNGVVTGISPGDVAITVTSGKIQTSSTIHVVKKEEIELVSLDITPNEVTLKIGETKNLIVTKLPTTANANIFWASSNHNVATVSQDGKVTAVSSGDAIITVTSGNITSSCTITVKKQETIDPTGEIDKLKVTFVTPYYYAPNREIQFEITVTNLTDSNIKKFSFDLSMPNGTVYNFWTDPGVQMSGNTFNVDMLWEKVIEVNGNSKITGYIVLPEGYSVENYINPQIKNIKLIG